MNELHLFTPDRAAFYAQQLELDLAENRVIMRRFKDKAYDVQLREFAAQLADIRNRLSDGEQAQLTALLEEVRLKVKQIIGAHIEKEVAERQSIWRQIFGKKGFDPEKITDLIVQDLTLLAEAEALNAFGRELALLEELYAKRFWTLADQEHRLSLIHPEQLLLFRRYAAPTSVLQVGGFKPTGDDFASNFGLAPVMRPEEEWPLDLNGGAMAFVAQFNLNGAPHIPEALSGVALLTFFVGEDFIESGCQPGTYELRFYNSLEGLERRTPPPCENEWVENGVEARWEPLAIDFPCYDDEVLLRDADDDDEIDEDEIEDVLHELNQDRTKLGGYATSVQHEVQFLPFVEVEESWHKNPNEPIYVFQIGSEDGAGLNWVDDGIVYFGYHAPTQEWHVSCQFY